MRATVRKDSKKEALRGQKRREKKKMWLKVGVSRQFIVAGVIREFEASVVDSFCRA